MSKKEQVAILGAGNMGTALAQVVASNGFVVKLWNHAGDLEPLQQITETRENQKYLPGIKLSANIESEADIEKALFGADVVFVVVPSVFVQKIIKSGASYISKKAICVDVSKGLDFTDKSYALTTDVLQKLLPKNKIASISGPAIAGQMALGKFTAMNVVSKDKNVIKVIKKIIENKNLRLIPTSDIIGVETSGSFKNVYAIALGMCDGMQITTNTKAVLFTVALREMAQLVKKMGGKSETVYGLAGLGDLFGTGLATVSRNRKFGEFVGSGLNTEHALAKVGQVVEGVPATKALHHLSKKFKLKMPLASLVYKIVYEQSNPQAEIEDFLNNLE